MSNPTDDWLKYNASEYTINGKTYRNLEAQVLKNMRDIEELEEGGEARVTYEDLETVFSVPETVATGDNGIEIEYETVEESIPKITIPLEGSTDVIVDVNETNDGIVIDLDQDVKNTLSRALQKDASAPAQFKLVGINTDNEQENRSIGVGLGLYGNTVFNDGVVSINGSKGSITGIATSTDLQQGLATKMTTGSVSVSATGTATDEIEYITIEGTEKKIKGGAALIWKSYTIFTSQWTASGDVWVWTTADPDLTSTSNIIASPAPSSMESAVDNGVFVSAVGLRSITFTAKTLPAVDITMNYAFQN